MRIMFVVNNTTRKIVAEPCDNDCTLEQVRGCWPTHRRDEEVVAVSEMQYPASELSENFLRANAEAFEAGELYGLGVVNARMKELCRV